MVVELVTLVGVVTVAFGNGDEVASGAISTPSQLGTGEEALNEVLAGFLIDGTVGIALFDTVQSLTVFGVFAASPIGVVFLDEPTGGVDPATRRQFWELIYEAAGRGITVFVTTHYMDEAEYCDRISIMVDGKIKAIGSPEELKRTYGQPDMDHVFTYLARQATRSSD